MRVAFIGSKQLGLRVLEATVNTTRGEHGFVGVIGADDRDDPRTVDSQLQAVAGNVGVPFIRAARSQEANRALAELDADLAIVCGWYLRLPVEESRTRFYGLHASLLPRYRGFAPIVWQILDGQREIGLSFFELTAGIDEGDIIAQTAVPFSEHHTIADALAALDIALPQIVQQHLPGLLDRTAEHRPQDHSAATYCGPRRPADGRIDWEQPARSIHDFIRAQSKPYPGAYSLLPDGKIVRIWRAAIDPRPYLAVPGRVCERGSDGSAVVGCDDGAIRVLRAQVDGEAEMPARDVLSPLSVRLS